MSLIKKTFGAVAIAAMALIVCPAQAAGELAGKTLRIGVDPTNPPFATLANDYITPVGLDIDIIMELKKRLGFELAENRILPMLRGEQLRRVKNKQIDVLAGCLSATIERTEFMDFSHIYFDTGLSVIYSKKKYNNVDDIKKFSNGKVGAVLGTTGEDFIDRNIPGAEKVQLSSFMIGIVAVTQGKLDAMVYDKPIIEYFAQTMPAFNLQIVDKIYDRHYGQIAFGFTKDSPYAYDISTEMYRMKLDGTLDKIIKKYFK